ncbi:hypothetical protein ZWY2020_015660 [Hordeum vulgare]|nr:hypothetical protein ZWY2020_015660 [Hordeum vulgare]
MGVQHSGVHRVEAARHHPAAPHAGRGRVGAPGYSFLVGNLGETKRLRNDTVGAALDIGDHNFVPMVQPHFRKWIPVHGRTFLYWFGARPSMCVADVNVVKQVLPNRSGMYPKNIRNPHIARLLSKGLVLANCNDWKYHRKVVLPAFNKSSRRSTRSVFMAADADGGVLFYWAVDSQGYGQLSEKIRLAGNQNVMVYMEMDECLHNWRDEKPNITACRV